jgi:hypothetical protein
VDSAVRTEAVAKAGAISQMKKSVADAFTEAIATACTGDITAVGQSLAVAVANASATAWVSHAAQQLLSGQLGAAGAALTEDQDPGHLLPMPHAAGLGS